MKSFLSFKDWKQFDLFVFSYYKLFYMQDYTGIDFSGYILNEIESELYSKLKQIKSDKLAAVSSQWYERAARLRDEEKLLSEELSIKLQIVQ